MILAVATGKARAETLIIRGAAQGTTYHIKYVVPAKGVDGSRLQSDVEKILAEVDRQMSTYRDDSEISRFNRAADDEWFTVSPAVLNVVQAAQAISEKTNGAMDVTVGPLVRLWHFGPGDQHGRNTRPPFKPPTNAELAKVRKCVGYKLLDIREAPPVLRKRCPGLEVDLSSIASGWTIDQLTELLIDHGVESFMVELGGEVRARGQREDGEPWRVAIERPLVGKREMQAAIPLANAAIATAGGTQKFFEHAGQRYSHIIDPSTGRPVTHTLASVTVAADSCMQADGWDTPLLVLGPELGFECAEKNGVAAMFISATNSRDEKPTTFEVKTTTAWQKRFPK
jgi:thiamine biosynthesis lipoprotein